MLKDRNFNIDENIFAALIVCQLKLGNKKNANDIIEQMKERDCPPTIFTYKEILTVLIREHKLNDFRTYFSQIDQQPSLSSTVYIDAQLILILLGQCISHKEQPIFEYLLPILKDLDRQQLDYYLFNLSIQCLSNQWYKYSIDLLQIQSNMNGQVHEKHWTLFFKYLFDNNQEELIGKLIQLMADKQLTPLDAILRVLYIHQKDSNHLALNYLEQGERIHHPIRVNYLYPLFINAHTSNQWTDDHRLRLYRLLNNHSISMDSQVFFRYYQNDFRSLFILLSTNNLHSILDRICCLLLHDIQHYILPINILEQIAPYFHLENHNRQKEFAKYLFNIIAETSNFEENSSSTDIFKTIDSVSKSLVNEIPLLKRELYINLLGLSVQNYREDLTLRFAQQCLTETVKIDRSINEIHTLTDHRLSDDIVEQLSQYKRDELSWKEKFLKMLNQKTTRKKLEEIYFEAKRDGRYPISIQQRLLDIYIQKQLINQAVDILKEMIENRYKV